MHFEYLHFSYCPAKVESGGGGRAKTNWIYFHPLFPHLFDELFFSSPCLAMGTDRENRGGGDSLIKQSYFSVEFFIAVGAGFNDFSCYSLRGKIIYLWIDCAVKAWEARLVDYYG